MPAIYRMGARGARNLKRFSLFISCRLSLGCRDAAVSELRHCCENYGKHKIAENKHTIYPFQLLSMGRPFWWWYCRTSSTKTGFVSPGFDSMEQRPEKTTQQECETAKRRYVKRSNRALERTQYTIYYTILYTIYIACMHLCCVVFGWISEVVCVSR